MDWNTLSLNTGLPPLPTYIMWSHFYRCPQKAWNKNQVVRSSLLIYNSHNNYGHVLFHTSDNTIQQNEFLIKGKIKAAAMLFDVIAFQTREREANSLLHSTPWLGLEELEFCSDLLTWILEIGKLELCDVVHHSYPEGMSVSSMAVHLCTFKSTENPAVVSRSHTRP